MGHTLFCVLGVFSLNILLYCGHAQDAVLTIEPNWSTLFTGESVTFICDMRMGEDTDWYYVIDRNGREFLPFGSVKRYTSQSLSIDDSGEYQCIGDPKRSAYSRKQSNKVSLTVSDKDVILESPASTVFEGESVTLRCRHRNHTKDKNAVFYKDGSPTERDTNHQSAMSSENTVQVISDGSSYMCKFEDEESEPVKLKMEPQPKARLSRYFPSVGSVTLTCSVSPSSSSSSSSSSGWKYFWYRGNKTSEPLTTKDNVFLSNETISVSQGGLYWCRGGRGDPLYYTEYSDSIVTNRAVVTLRPNRSEIYTEEKIILTCEIEDGGDAEWEYEWTTSSSYRPEKQKENMIRYALSSYNGEYRCVGTLKHEKSSTEWSDAFTLRVSDYPVFPDLTVSPLWLSPGASVTLNCSVRHRSPGWRFFWYKAVPSLSNNSYSYELIPGKIHGTEQDSYIVDGQTHTAGYVCGVQRGYPVYFSYVSRPKFVWSGDSHSAASLTVSPDRMQHFRREPVSLSCEGNSAEWRVSRFSVDGYPRHCSSSSSSSWGNMTGSRCSMDRDWQSGVYWCESETGQFSNAVNITIQYKPQPVLTVSPLWLSPGASVTLNCSVEHPSAGWRFFWYKAVPKLSDNSYSYELIPGSINGTEQDSYIVDGQTHTAGYVCRAGRGDPVYYTHYSEPKFVWYGDSHSAASLTVSPDRMQHFSREPVSLSCEGNSAEWRVSRFSEDGYLRHCSSSSSSSWGTMTGSRCSMDRDWQSGVYWCESETGQFSNAVNITIQYGNIILVSPVHPVTEGDSVTLGCKFRTEKVHYIVDFYKNDGHIRNVTGGELTISAVSKSDEGFYKCKGKNSPQGSQRWTSPESWMSVKSAPRLEGSSPFPVLLIVGPVCGVLLILLLLLFVCCYRKSKGENFYF